MTGISLYPILPDKIFLQPLRLARSLLPLPVLTPRRLRRRRGEDQFGAPVRLESQVDAANPDEIEFETRTATTIPLLPLNVAASSVDGGDGVRGH